MYYMHEIAASHLVYLMYVDTFNTNLWEVIILCVYETLLWKGIFELLQLLSYNFSIYII